MLYKTILLCYTLSAFTVSFSNSARILAITPLPSYSHQSVYRPLWRELLSRGHEIILITTDPMHDQNLINLTEIDIHFSYGFIKQIDKEYNMNQNISFADQKRLGVSTSANMTDLQLLLPKVKMLIQSKNLHFDLVITGFFLPHALLAFSEKFKCPYIGIVSQDPSAITYETVGNPVHPVLYPNFMLGFSDTLTFWERLRSVFSYVYMKMVTYQEFAKAHDTLVEKHFGKGYPPLEEIFNKVSMLFVYTNPIIHPIKPLVPTVIEIGGGSHIKSSEQLSKVIRNDKKYLLILLAHF